MKTTIKRSGPTVYLAPAVTILAAIALYGPNIVTGLYACLTLAICVVLLWRPEEPPVLMFLAVYQWLQINVLAFYGNLLGEPLSQFPGFPGEHEEAVYLANTGLVVLSLAIRSTAGKPREGLSDWLKAKLKNYPAYVWVYIYVITWSVSFLCSAAAPYAGGLRQPLLILAELKWAAFLLLTASTFAVKGRPRAPWALAFTVELLMSVGGFFGDFRYVFIYAMIGLTFLGTDFLRKHKFLLSLCVLLALAFAIAWTAVKRDYRSFISQGTGEQVVLVRYGDRIGSLTDRVSNLDGRAMADGADKLVRRLSYFEFFGVVLRREELGQPHTGGEIWGYAVVAPLMPRLLFPNKAIIDDTKLTIKYTGIRPEAWKTGVSVSMGYMAEAFLDFGKVFMFAAIAGLGVLIGGLYRWLLDQRGIRLVMAIGLAPMAVMQALVLEISILKLLPALALSFLSCWATLNYLGPLLFSSLGAQWRKPSPQAAG